MGTDNSSNKDSISCLLMKRNTSAETEGGSHLQLIFLVQSSSSAARGVCKAEASAGYDRIE